MTKNLTIDNDFRDLIPPLRLDERAELEASIQQDGCRDPLTVWSGTVIDGHNRYEICTRLSMPFEVVEKEFDSKVDALIWIRRNQLARRNLTDDQRAINAERLRQLESQKVKSAAATARNLQRSNSDNVSDHEPDKKPKRDTRKEMAENSKLPERKLRGAALVIKERPDLADKVEQGEIKMADAVREIKRAEVVASLESVEAREQKALEGVYDVIVIDPPWPMQKIDRDERQNQVAFDYPTM